MSKSLGFATLAALLFGACVINDDIDDDGASDTSTNPSTTDPSTTDPSTTDPSTTATTATTASTTDASTTDEPTDTGTTEDPSDTSATETGDPGSCGWGRTGEKTIPEGYVCGGEGEDPTGLMPSACAEGVELVEEGECGGEMGITGVGCCDADGNVWFCADDGSGRKLFTEDC